jgi:hypothetical protein
VRHGVNGLIVDWDDPRGTARALDLLATDRALLHELRCGALATARAWPSWEQAGAFMALALRRIAAEPPPSPRATGRRLTRDFQANLAFAQRNLIDHRITTELLLDIQGQRAWRWGVAIRTFVLRLAWPVRRVLQVVRGRRGG